MNKIYTTPLKRGIHDLKPTIAYRGTWGQGDHYYSNEVGIEHPSYVRFVLDCEETQEAVDKLVSENKAFNEAYIKELKEKGIYGEVYDELILTLIHNPKYDDIPGIKNLTMDSWRMEILDFNNNSLNNNTLT